jgi:hypothetical protein
VVWGSMQVSESAHSLISTRLGAVWSGRPLMEDWSRVFAVNPNRQPCLWIGKGKGKRYFGSGCGWSSHIGERSCSRKLRVFRSKVMGVELGSYRCLVAKILLIFIYTIICHMTSNITPFPYMSCIFLVCL